MLLRLLTSVVDHWERRWLISAQASDLPAVESVRVVRCTAFPEPEPCIHSCSAVLDCQLTE